MAMTLISVIGSYVQTFWKETRKVNVNKISHKLVLTVEKTAHNMYPS